MNGSTATGACGVAGATGTFTVMGHEGGNGSPAVVDVIATTTFTELGANGPTFANICVGEMVSATGSTSGGAVQAATVTIWSPMPPPAVAFGLVGSVNGSTATGACGDAGMSGTFTVTGHEGRNSSQTTVDVTATTTFTEHGASTPTFANVCVGEMVGATGTTSSGAVQAATVTIWSPMPPPPPAVAFGLVGSVNGSTATGACGDAGMPGTFTVTGHEGRNSSQTTVDVTATTTFTEHGASTPTFVNVCVGEMVGATSTTSSGALQATNVTIWSPKPPKTGFATFGMVISVNGSTTAGTCGVAGTSGTFTLIGHNRHHNNSQTVVNVTATTTFTEHAVSAPTFANVCVNGTAGAQGTVSAGALQATTVKIWSPPAIPPSTAFGMVISVNGSTTAGACGVAGMSGTFTVMGRNSTQTVIHVNATTTFTERAMSTPSFANVCANTTAVATGTTANNTLNANSVQIWSSPATS
ncbi:MAG: hypothetical protein ACLPVY_11170 [Acidimicrobiia bacterium]